MACYVHLYTRTLITDYGTEIFEVVYCSQRLPLYRDVSLLKLKFSQYSSIHNNYIIPHCTTLQYNHNI